MSDQHSLLPERATIPAEDWEAMRQRAHGDKELMRDFVWTYQDGWLAAWKSVNELLIAMIPPPQPPPSKEPS